MSWTTAPQVTVQQTTPTPSSTFRTYTCLQCTDSSDSVLPLALVAGVAMALAHRLPLRQRWSTSRRVHTRSLVRSCTSSASVYLSALLIVGSFSSYYYTQMIGDARVPPTIAASSDFTGIAVIGKFNSLFRSCGVAVRSHRAFHCWRSRVRLRAVKPTA